MLLGSLSSSQQVAWTINKAYRVQTLLLRWSGCRAHLKVSQVYYWTASWTCSEYPAVERSAPQAPWDGPGAAIQWSSFSPLNAYNWGIPYANSKQHVIFLCQRLGPDQEVGSLQATRVWNLIRKLEVCQAKLKGFSRKQIEENQGCSFERNSVCIFFKQYDRKLRMLTGIVRYLFWPHPFALVRVCL